MIIDDNLPPSDRPFSMDLNTYAIRNWHQDSEVGMSYGDWKLNNLIRNNYPWGYRPDDYELRAISRLVILGLVYRMLSTGKVYPVNPPELKAH